MIRLEVEPYCENCLIFKPEVEPPQKRYCGCNLIAVSDTVIYCQLRGTCAGIARYLKREMQKKEE